MRRLPKTPQIYETLLPTKDGYIAPVFYGYVDWQAFATMMQCPELDDPKYADPAGRAVNAEELAAILTREFSKWTKQELVRTAQDWRFPFAVVQTIGDVYNCEQLLERNYFVKLAHAKAGEAAMPAAPFKMSETPARIRRAAPLLGEHNEEIYCGLLGFSQPELKRLAQTGII